MVIGTVRRISALFLTLALVLGPAMGGAYASLGIGKATVITVSGDSHSPGKCNDCGSSKGGMPAGLCSPGTFCGAFAIPPVSHFVPERRPSRQALLFEHHYLIGRADAPDPYPPRPTILS